MSENFYYDRRLISLSSAVDYVMISGWRKRGKKKSGWKDNQLSLIIMIYGGRVWGWVA